MSRSIEMMALSDGGFRALVDAANGTVEPQIFSDPAIYQAELERIFARAWNFMCHESQIPNPGDFFLNFIGEEGVIATRDRAGTLQVFLNSCRHRGNAVCRAESGNTRSFLCTYHGWTYGLDGKLIGVPGYREFYHEQLDRSQWGLISAGKVESYKGFVFATMDPDAPELHDYLGEVGRLALDLTAERGDMVAVEGVQKNVIGCNWKLAVDNVFDFYHAITHTSAGMIGYSRASAVISEAQHRVVLGEYGHGIAGLRITPEMRKMAEEKGDKVDPFRDERWRDRESARMALGAAGRDTRGNPNIFPNLWAAAGHNGTQLALRVPKGPTRTELWWFTLADKNLAPEQRATMINRTNHTVSPAAR